MNSRQPPSPWLSTLKQLWASPWFRWPAILFALWLIRQTPGWIQLAIDRHQQTVIVSTEAKNYNTRGIYSFRWTAPASGGHGGGHAPRLTEDGHPGSGGTGCCGFLQLRKDQEIDVEWEWDRIPGERDNGIAPPPPRKVRVKLDLQGYDPDPLNENNVRLVIYFMPDGGVGARVSNLIRDARENRIPTLFSPSVEIPPAQ